MQGTHQLLKHACGSPVLVVPVDGRVGGQVSGQVSPVAAVFKLIEDAIEDLTF